MKDTQTATLINVLQSRNTVMNEIMKNEKGKMRKGPEKMSNGLRNIITKDLTMYQTLSQELRTEARRKTEIHKCLVCEKRFERLSRLRIHQLKHSEERSFPCDNCTKAFKFKSGLSRHQRKEHAGGTHGDLKTTACEWQEQEQSLNVKETLTRPCRYCCELFPDTILAYHMERCEKAKVHKCPECDMLFRKPSKLADHRRKHSDERLFSCQICTKSFKYKGGLSRHMREQHSQREIEPNTVFDEREDRRNGLEYDGRKTETWKEEQNSLKEESLQQEQTRYETEGSSEFCEELLEDIESSFVLTSGSSDISNKHVSDCNECGRSKPDTFTSEENNLEENLVQGRKDFEGEEIENEKLDLSHQEDTVHKCPECEMVFLKPSAQANHRCKHCDERAFHCEICKYKGGLDRHMIEQHGQESMLPSMVFCEREEIEKRFSLEDGASGIEMCKKENNLEEENWQQQRNGLETVEMSQFCEEGFEEEFESGFKLNSETSDISNRHFAGPNLCDLSIPDPCKNEENNLEKENLLQAQDRLGCDEILYKKDDVALCKGSVEQSERDFEFRSRTSHNSSKRFVDVKLPVFSKRCKKDKIYRCSDCEKVFRKPSALTIHKRKHSDERLFTCNICRKSFKYKGGVTRHLREQHGETKKNSVNMEVGYSTLGRMNILASNEQENKSNYEANDHGEDTLNFEKSNVESNRSNLENTDNNSQFCEEMLQGDARSEQKSNPSEFYNETAPKSKLSKHTERGKKVKVHKCPNCDKIFRTRSKLSVHQLKHSDQRLFACEICKTKFKHRWGKTRHMRRQHGQRTTNLSVVGSKATRNEASNSTSGTKESINFNENFGNQSCELEQVSHGEIDSNQVFRNFGENSGNKEANSDLCEENLKIENAFEMSSEPCPVLDETFLTAIKSSLVRKRKKPKLYKCDDCEREFRRPSALVTHKRKHSDERLFSCNICSTLFKHKWGLTRHLKKQHGQVETCQIDERQVDKASVSSVDELHNMNNPIDYNCEENNFAEESFGKDFEREERNLENKEDGSEFFQENSKVAGNNLEQNCEPYEFPRENLPDTTLLDLIQRCQKAKFYKCLECRKVFRKSSALQSHQRKHSDQRLFACDICGKSFKHKGGAARHLKERHAQERNGETMMFVDTREENDKNSSLQGKDQLSKADNFESILNEEAKDERKNSLQEQCGFETKEKDFQIEQGNLDGDNLEDVCFHIFGKQKIYKCPECPRAFLAFSELREHRYKHMDIKSFPCKLCSKAFKFRSGLRRHNRKEHGNGLKKVQSSVKVCNIETQMLESGDEMLERLERTNSCEELNESVADNFVEVVNHHHIAINLPSKRDPSCSPATIIDGELPLAKVSAKGVYENLSLKKPPVLYSCNKCDAKFKELCDFLTHQRIHK